MDETLTPTGPHDLPTGDGAHPTGERNHPNEQDEVTARSRPSSRAARSVPLWGAVVGALAGVLLAFGGGVAVNAGDADDVRDELNADISSLHEESDRLNEKAAGSQASLDTAMAGLAQCQGAVEGATAMAAAADDLAGDWDEQGRLLADWYAAATGSPEEAQAVAALGEIDAQMSTKFGALSATADRVTADSDACAEA
jgi:hypothetical protein